MIKRISKIDQNKSFQNENRSFQLRRYRRYILGDVHFVQNDLRMRKLLSFELSVKQVNLEREKIEKKTPPYYKVYTLMS